MGTLNCSNYSVYLLLCVIGIGKHRLAVSGVELCVVLEAASLCRRKDFLSSMNYCIHSRGFFL